MKIKLIAILSIIASAAGYGQNVKVRTEKMDYKFFETITVVYEVNSMVDSIEHIKGKNFKILETPTNYRTVSTINGNTTLTYTLNYKIKATKIGKLEIVSPAFYIGGKAYEAEILSLNISDMNLTDKEIEEINFNDFKDDSVKPEGTIRIVLSDEFGYVEEFKTLKWNYKRRLSKKEIKKIKKGN